METFEELKSLYNVQKSSDHINIKFIKDKMMRHKRKLSIKYALNALQLIIASGILIYLGFIRKDHNLLQNLGIIVLVAGVLFAAVMRFIQISKLNGIRRTLNSTDYLATLKSFYSFIQRSHLVLYIVYACLIFTGFLISLLATEKSYTGWDIILTIAAVTLILLSFYFLFKKLENAEGKKIKNLIGELEAIEKQVNAME